jgi:hypothetical protein
VTLKTLEVENLFVVVKLRDVFLQLVDHYRVEEIVKILNRVLEVEGIKLVKFAWHFANLSLQRNQFLSDEFVLESNFRNSFCRSVKKTSVDEDILVPNTPQSENFEEDGCDVQPRCHSLVLDTKHR